MTIPSTQNQEELQQKSQGKELHIKVHVVYFLDLSLIQTVGKGCGMDTVQWCNYVVLE